VHYSKKQFNAGAFNVFILYPQWKLFFLSYMRAREEFFPCFLEQNKWKQKKPSRGAFT